METGVFPQQKVFARSTLEPPVSAALTVGIRRAVGALCEGRPPLNRATTRSIGYCLLLPAWAIMFVVAGQARVLCVGADGHVSIEFSQLGKCGAFLSPGRPGAPPNESLSGVEDANHCGTCVDTPVTQTAVRIGCARNTPAQFVRAAQPELASFTFCCSVEGAPGVRPFVDVLPLDFVRSPVDRSVVLLL